MEHQSNNPAAPHRQTRLKGIAWEVAIVAAVGAVFALVANGVSPRGLALTQDYFPGAQQTAIPPQPPPHASMTRITNSPAGQLVDQLKAEGLGYVDGNGMAQLFHDPRYEQENIIFIDARDDRHYQAGHIPGAYQFDHYHAENYLAAVLPACQSADQIVVYCAGGACEDSKYTALTLRDAGVPREKLFVYAGGITEWSANSLPLETSDRKSGNLLPPNHEPQ